MGSRACGGFLPISLRRLRVRGLISVFALVFQHAPLPTSPVDGGGAATPSPPAGRVGVGAMFKCKGTYKRVGVGAFKAQGLTIPEKWGIIGIAVRWRERAAETQLKEEQR